MKAKHVWWTSAAVVTAAAVAAAAGLGISVQRAYEGLDHGQPYAAAQPATPVVPVTEEGELNKQALKARLDAVAKEKSKDLATLGAQVADTSTGESLWERQPTKPLTPASSTKVLTLAAATYALDEGERLRTEAMRASEDTVAIKASGDVWMDEKRLDAFAADIKQAMPGVKKVLLDTSAWAGPAQATGWEPDNVDGGYVAPMEPLMLYGGRIGQTTGDVPRSHTPAVDAAQSLAARLGARAEAGAAPKGGEVIASTESEPLALRAQEAAKDSDNVMAEAIGRELAIARGKEASFTGAAQATLEVLTEHGLDVSGVTLHDNSGLSVDNRIPPALLTQIMVQAAEQDALRPLLGYLPLAGGEGTLYTRYTGSPARGFVKAKTGTLTGVSALTGTAQGTSGRVYAFTFLVNGGEINSARAAQDALAAALHEF
ncbi:D-alanyl-D-alanine carboxypeptidase/D-alanyl-D-alanine-endopeptidase [Corynebacterium sp.]|uniref:D-alanyl-D-alanine carboxypeptidase/D-alanyl-D-alanine endopeptidase n=1 Tax=Corynebacterium sp. TaxID=1720 RepID=UPI0026DB5F27|nr:D-alanyl-D-alanine carboxypeptidase/D-alanyl-D-alanine-endopeptidase [Corynebacterium sp.]MDO5032268.1 D-alanyl-D-alanine carboxypeptidase/D-alanyl-D-alanine-endopeptidase [Corynebacterium sp.]